MKIIKQTNEKNIFPYIAYIPDKVSPTPALLIQLHGAGERGNGVELKCFENADMDVSRIERHCGFSPSYD